MNVILSDRARIALDHIPPAERKNADIFFADLRHFPAGDTLQKQIRKVPGREKPNLYVGRLGLNFRALFSTKGNEIEVLEVVDHDRLVRFGIEAAAH